MSLWKGKGLEQWPSVGLTAPGGDNRLLFFGTVCGYACMNVCMCEWWCILLSLLFHQHIHTQTHTPYPLTPSPFHTPTTTLTQYTALGERPAASPLLERAVTATLQVFRGENEEENEGDVAPVTVASDEGKCLYYKRQVLFYSV